MSVVHLEHQFPLEPAVAKDVAAFVDYGASIGNATSAEVTDLIRERWAFPDFPRLQCLTDTVCEKSLACLTQYEDDYLFTFHDSDGFPLSLPIKNGEPAPFLDGIHTDGFSDFMCKFGGLVDGHLPPGACVLPPNGSSVVEQETDDYIPDFTWGEVGLWHGARTFFHSCSGNVLIIHPSGQLGRWFHEIGWGHDDEIAVHAVEMSFPELVEDFAKDLSTLLDDRDMYSVWT